MSDHPHATVKVASYNIRKALGTDRVRNPLRILKVLQEIDADIVALQEADRRFGVRSSVLPQMLIDHHTDYVPVPLDVQQDSMGWHGNAILVRKGMEVTHHDIIHIPYLEPRGVVTATVETPGGAKLSVFGMHLDLSGLWRGRQARAITELAEAAQADAVARHVGIFLHQPGDVARQWVAFHAQEQVGAAEVEEAERVALHQLSPVHEAAQFGRGGRNLHAQDGVAGFGRGEQVADRADAADARGDPRHFPEAAPFAEFLEAAKLGDMEAGIVHLAVVAEVDGDFGVPFDAGHGINGDGLRHGRCLLIERPAQGGGAAG